MISCYMKDRSFMALAEYCAQFKLSPLYKTNPCLISSVFLLNNTGYLKQLITNMNKRFRYCINIRDA